MTPREKQAVLVGGFHCTLVATPRDPGQLLIRFIKGIQTCGVPCFSEQPYVNRPGYNSGKNMMMMVELHKYLSVKYINTVCIYIYCIYQNIYIYIYTHSYVYRIQINQI